MNYNYHDSILNHLHANWVARTIELELQLCSVDVTIISFVINEVSELYYPHHSPWGESSVINEIRIKAEGDKNRKIEIEMQSGDIIVICGSEIIETKR